MLGFLTEIVDRSLHSIHQGVLACLFEAYLKEQCSWTRFVALSTAANRLPPEAWGPLPGWGIRNRGAASLRGS